MDHARRLTFHGPVCRVASPATYGQSFTAHYLIEYGAKQFERSFNRTKVMLVNKTEFEDRFVSLYKGHHNLEFAGQTTDELTDKLEETVEMVEQQLLLEFDDLAEQLRNALDGKDTAPAAGHIPIIDVYRLALSCLSELGQTPDVMSDQSNRNRNAKTATLNILSKSTPEKRQSNATEHIYARTIRKERSHLKQVQRVKKSNAVKRRHSERIAERLGASTAESI